MTQGPQEPQGPLPEPLEAELFRLHFDLRQPDADAAFDRLCEAHREHAAALRLARAKMLRTDELLGRVRETGLPSTAASSPSPPPADLPARRFGPFTLVRLLGRGGFGEVWLAQQHEPIHRLVALKLLREATGDGQALARFHFERQALALLHHDHVASVFDAGVDATGRPFLAMEYVEGQPLTVHCDAAQLSVRDRLRLFLLVCAGVHHAHQKGVLHRDLKPSNILVSVQEGTATPKIIDFGVAKLLHGEPGDRAAMTEQGRLLGTPEYMSPEQAAGGMVDTRADVYSLGVVLYELLTGELPFTSTELRKAGMLEALRILTDRPPERPSKRLSRDQKQAEAAASLRSTTVADLHQALRGDLDFLVLRALAKDPNQRYASVTSLAADVQRFLDDQPLAARPVTRLYLLRKFVQRHRAGVAFSAAVLLLLLLALIGAFWGLLVVEDARRTAVREGRRAEAVAYAAQVAGAGLALRSGDVVGARQQLLGAAQHLRGFEWRYLAARCAQEQTRFAANRMLDAVVLDDGRHLLGVGFDGTVRQWDLEQGRQVAQWRGQGDTRRSIDRSATARHVAVAGQDGQLELFDEDTGRRLWGTELHIPGTSTPAQLQAVHFLPDGSLACGGRDGLLWLVLPLAGVQRVVETGQTWIRSIDISADGRHCLTAGEGGVVCLWDPVTWHRKHWLQAHEPVAVFDARFAPDGRTFATCAADGAVKLFDTSDPARALWVHRTSTKLLRLRFSPDGRRLAVSGGFADSHLEVLDTAGGSSPGPLLGHEQGVEMLAFSPDSKRLMSSGYDESLRIWNLERSPAYRSYRHDHSLTDLAVDRRGTTVVVASSTGRVAGVDAATLQARWTTVVEGEVLAVAIDDERERVLALHPEGMAVLDLASGALQQRHAGFRDLVDCTAPGGDDVLALTAASVLRLDAATLQQRTPAIALPGPGFAVAATADAVAALTTDGWLVVWDRASWQPRFLRRVSTEQGFHDVALSPDGRFLAVTAAGGLVLLFDGDGSELARFEGHRNFATVGFTADGKRLASAGADRRVRIYDPERRLELVTLTDAPYPAARPRFSPDGSALYCLASVFTAPGLLLEWSAPATAMLR